MLYTLPLSKRGKVSCFFVILPKQLDLRPMSKLCYCTELNNIVGTIISRNRPNFSNQQFFNHHTASTILRHIHCYLVNPVPSMSKV